jgi:hypothetical protein
MLTGAAKDCAQFAPAGMASDPYAWPGRAIRRDRSAHDGSPTMARPTIAAIREWLLTEAAEAGIQRANSRRLAQLAARNRRS